MPSSQGHPNCAGQALAIVALRAVLAKLGLHQVCKLLQEATLGRIRCAGYTWAASDQHCSCNVKSWMPSKRLTTTTSPCAPTCPRLRS
ncbi:hypothetical protein DUNSADRAFT_8623 [Dunaliella salina]|uniref:Uncharacterized protein n=1 Tax=Dunaliella salina TaxID=3046 RepID=A0ABQ7H5T4_DUNSA|nr:hypothetical protein DUNSADRAFT_8623 [Dunaliella salina]|eukprot:KAF5842223.1 hypothetical protein DUNSADRAFT_8623 [Dunaliella salina]